MQGDFSPSKNHSCWLKVDYETLLQNFQRHSEQAPYVDLSVPFIVAIWSHLEDDLLRAGIAGVLGADPRALCKVSGSLLRFLKPGYKPGESGYASEGIIPVLGSFSDCLSLSNMAQMLDKRLTFLLRVRSGESEFAGGDWGIESICQRLGNLPMLDLGGLFLNKCPDIEQQAYLRRLLHQAHAESTQMLLPLASADHNAREFRRFTLWENLALGQEDEGCMPFELGFWAFPVSNGSDYQIFQTDLGRLHGLRKDFPAQIAGKTARIIEVWPDSCELIVSGHYSGPFPARGYLTGGLEHNPIDLRQWDKSDLQNIMGNLSFCPVYLQKAGKILEIFQ